MLNSLPPARRCGLLLPVFSLPSRFGTGDLGPEAYRFIDLISAAGLKIWQVLPLNPVSSNSGFSPYSSYSLFAGNPFLISPEILYQDGLIRRYELNNLDESRAGRVLYERISAAIEDLHRTACLRAKSKFVAEIGEFKKNQRHWLTKHALFSTLMRLYPDSSWHEWPSLRITSDLKKQLEIEEIRQFLFFRQWERLKKYCSSKNILLVGDIPIYADYESADVWSHPEFFKLNKLKLPEVVSGVPPDYFSSTGQRWGNPVYRWNLLKNDGFRWWLQRIQLNFSFFDLIRLDHFRGFYEFWEIPAFDKTAVNGYWVKGPQKAFLKSITQQFHASRFIAEDLGHITPGVRQLMNEFGLPGMRLVQFAFRDDPSNHPMAPHNHIPNCVVYTGTHDNNTIRGWFEEELTERQRSTIFRYIGRRISSRSVHHEFVKLAMMSVANTAILPVQDVLGLGASSRINKPSTTDRNWRWRLRPGQLNERSIEWIGQLVAISGR